MKLNNVVCMCGNDDVFLMQRKGEKVTHTGIYCAKCGKWIKWASKNERNLAFKGESEVESKGEKNDLQ